MEKACWWEILFRFTGEKLKLVGKILHSINPNKNSRHRSFGYHTCHTNTKAREAFFSLYALKTRSFLMLNALHTWQNYLKLSQKPWGSHTAYKWIITSTFWGAYLALDFIYRTLVPAAEIRDHETGLVSGPFSWFQMQFRRSIYQCPGLFKDQTIWEVQKKLRNLPHALYIYLVNVQTMRKIFFNTIF